MMMRSWPHHVLMHTCLQDIPPWNVSSVFKGLLPRGKMPNPLRERNAVVNQLVQEAVSSLPHASFLSVDPGFVHSSGSISHQDMYDYLHLTPRGYQAVCEPLHAQLKSMLDEPSENWAAAAHLKWLSSLVAESITLNIFMFSDPWNPFLRAIVGDRCSGTINLVHMIPFEIKCAALASVLSKHLFCSHVPCSSTGFCDFSATLYWWLLEDSDMRWHAATLLIYPVVLNDLWKCTGVLQICCRSQLHCPSEMFAPHATAWAAALLNWSSLDDRISAFVLKTWFICKCPVCLKILAQEADERAINYSCSSDYFGGLKYKTSP